MVLLTNNGGELTSDTNKLRGVVVETKGLKGIYKTNEKEEEEVITLQYYDLITIFMITFC